MARASIPNVVLPLALCACGSAVFYDEVPDPGATAAAEEPADRWKEAGPLGPGPRFDQGISCEDSIAIARVRVLEGLETAKGLRYYDRQKCLADKAQALAALAGIEREDREEGDSCVAAERVFREAEACGGTSPSIETTSLQHRY
ncbi:MAG: hypothetical protein HOV80_08390 [Polyangiaceae bacterium]|nr:hypothetical protein [Polyangiaceae bacterium]